MNDAIFGERFAFSNLGNRTFDYIVLKASLDVNYSLNCNLLLFRCNSQPSCW